MEKGKLKTSTIDLFHLSVLSVLSSFISLKEADTPFLFMCRGKQTLLAATEPLG